MENKTNKQLGAYIIRLNKNWLKLDEEQQCMPYHSKGTNYSENLNDRVNKNEANMDRTFEELCKRISALYNIGALEGITIEQHNEYSNRIEKDFNIPNEYQWLVGDGNWS